jgi:hypothetical protein
VSKATPCGVACEVDRNWLDCGESAARHLVSARHFGRFRLCCPSPARLLFLHKSVSPPVLQTNQEAQRAASGEK